MDRPRVSRCGDHPRSRGVYVTPVTRSSDTSGSSPLARGLPGDEPAQGPSRGDHPRSRGVYRAKGHQRAASDGSSPLARGLRAFEKRETMYGSSPLARGLLPGAGVTGNGKGIIPARAGFTCAAARGRAGREDHPRSRGVYTMTGEGGTMTMGSSPLARGLRAQPFDFFRSDRIIPARAGFTTTSPLRVFWTPDHPRSRGVYISAHHHPRPTQGSSPLARGLQDTCLTAHKLTRIIPARAGFTRSSPARTRRCGDHPRSRGVYPWRPSAMAVWRGSSPLARGLHRAQALGPLALGIIPARAGFTARPSTPSPGRSDHPRSRGVYWRTFSSIFRTEGSSPLARGLLRVEGRATVVLGIIPARAGFTSCCRGWRPWTRDHPRSRGVYLAPLAPPHRGVGSSPLARGLLPHGRGDLPDVGIIPARAGFTLANLTAAIARLDHPRSRGVYWPSACWPTRSSGSSPLARGLPVLAAAGQGAGGIIPARAGFTDR